MFSNKRGFEIYAASSRFANILIVGNGQTRIEIKRLNFFHFKNMFLQICIYSKFLLAAQNIGVGARDV